ncbi:GDSL-type esterase/lipase family protein [Alkalicoccobacillus murimartini]|uniref:Lysophospholipase L1-like esterase n=1 Tax=Alkalicoccobacillus murimartini TaxID=171685 RepID=A0ABT9YI68_9BACI|nr:GDSL-type esterase/lipase family protein [Alkalicoccobacillus murimartini]MDQ0207565.1 lysophospholipase L1-like esterase [Alkalicoccobacillus murimartini]
MKKKWIVLLLLLIIAIGIGIYINGSTQSKPSFQEVTIVDNEEIDESEQTDPPEEEPETIEDDNVEETEQGPLSDFIVRAAQNTVHFFSNRETKITAIGDSLTQGIGSVNEEGGYVGILDRSINQSEQVVTVNNFGRRGNRSAQMLERLELPEVVDSIEESDIVLITIGANDIMRVLRENITDLNLDPFYEERDLYEETLNEITDTIFEMNPNTDIYLLGIYNPYLQYFGDVEELGVILEEWNDTTENIADDNDQIFYVPTEDLFSEDTEGDLLADDRFHPNDAGYKLMAQRVLDYLSEDEG